jgi:hypothetical protein
MRESKTKDLTSFCVSDSDLLIPVPANLSLPGIIPLSSFNYYNRQKTMEFDYLAEKKQEQKERGMMPGSDKSKNAGKQNKGPHLILRFGF